MEKYSDADDYCDACCEEVASHECAEGILCCGCYAELHGPCYHNDYPTETK